MVSTFLQAVAVVGVIVTVLGAAALVPQGQGGSNPYASSGSSTAYNGLMLTLSLNSTKVSSGGVIGMTVSEYNTLSVHNNVSHASDWLVQGQLGACGDAIYPYGIAVFAGRVGAANVSVAIPIQAFPLAPCPLFIRLITGYLFLPLSENATLLPGTYSLQMANQVAVGRDYSGGEPSGLPFSQGTYTIAAFDEWGNAVFLYATVS